MHKYSWIYNFATFRLYSIKYITGIRVHSLLSQRQIWHDCVLHYISSFQYFLSTRRLRWVFNQHCNGSTSGKDRLCKLWEFLDNHMTASAVWTHGALSFFTGAIQIIILYVWWGYLWTKQGISGLLKRTAACLKLARIITTLHRACMDRIYSFHNLFHNFGLLVLATNW